jgi:pimeloyl-ACP methyl ester carboxylesterase
MRLGWVGSFGMTVLCLCSFGCADKRDDRAHGDAGMAGAGGLAGSDGAAADGGDAGSGSGSMADSGTPPDDHRDAGGGPMPDADIPMGMVPIDPPVADDCITDVSPGEHTFTCQGRRFLVTVDERCTRFACGLIFDVHGAAMTAEIMRENTQLHELAPSRGYLVVHPSASTGPAAWNLQTDPPILADFMTRMIAAFHVDERRVHMTGFSMGAAMTFWFLCNHREPLASVGPITGASADQVNVASTGQPCIPSIDETWQPRVPILFMSGRLDNALTISAAQARTEGIVSRLGLTGGDMIDGDDTYTRRRWQGEGGMVFDFLEHSYSNAIIAGHCIPGGPPGNYIACTAGGDSLHWGEVVLQWFIDHPKGP